MDDCVKMRVVFRRVCWATFLVITSFVLQAYPTQRSLAQSSGGSPLGNSGVILYEDFEGATTVMDEALKGSASSITSAVSFSGTRSLEMDNVDGSKFSERFSLGGGWDTLYARYMFRVGNATSSCWDSGEHYKNMGFEGGTSDCKGADYTSDGTDCFTVRSRFNYPHIGVHVESPPYPGEFDDLNEEVNVADGNWHCFEFRVKLNTPGSKNGEIRYWVDGKEKVRENLEFRTVNSLQINKWWFTYWSNDAWCGPLYLDDLVISESPIGCPGTAAPGDRTPPANPRRLSIIE